MEKKNNTVNPDYRVDIEIVSVANLTKMQQKLNQWITTGILVKYKTTVVDSDTILFEIVRLKDSSPF